MGSWGKHGDWKPSAKSVAHQDAKPRSGKFRIRRGKPDEVWIVSFCPIHGFTEAVFTRAVSPDVSAFTGDCGCEILHGDFLVIHENGAVGKISHAKIKAS